VVIIDDEEPVREAVEEILRLEGIDVLGAADGMEGLSLCRSREDIRLVLLDLSMPGLGGRETLREIKQMAPDLPVILSSGYSEAEALGALAADTLAGFLQKPYDAARLVAEVRRFVVAGG
jgi:CheY-like chemotaxis protein